MKFFAKFIKIRFRSIDWLLQLLFSVSPIKNTCIPKLSKTFYWVQLQLPAGFISEMKIVRGVSLLLSDGFIQIFHVQQAGKRCRCANLLPSESPVQIFHVQQVMEYTDPKHVEFRYYICYVLSTGEKLVCDMVVAELVQTQHMFTMACLKSLAQPQYVSLRECEPMW